MATQRRLAKNAAVKSEMDRRRRARSAWARHNRSVAAEAAKARGRSA